MTRRVGTLEALSLTGEIANAGHRARPDGERCTVDVVVVPWGGGYCAWCGAPCAGIIACYRDPTAAIREPTQR